MNLTRIILATSLLLAWQDAALAYDVWNQKANFGGPARHRCVAFAIGNKGYMGLGHINAVTDILFEDIWEYDPATNSWSQKANFGGGLRYHSFGFTIGNKGYVGTGRMPSGVYENDCWEFDPVANTWLQRADMPGALRRGAVSFVIDNIGYVGSGQVQSGISNEFFAFNPVTNSWQQKATFPGATRTSAVAFAIDGKGYFGTGGMGTGTKDFWEYDPQTNMWTQKADVGPTARLEATGFAVNGKGYIGTGVDMSSGNNFGDMWQYNVSTNTWTQVEDFGGIKRRYLASMVIGTKVYAGTGTNGTNFRDFWEFDQLLSIGNQNDLENSFQVYPNPITDIFTVKIIANMEAEFSLYNQLGQIVFAQSLVDESTTIDRNNIAAGHYIYAIRISDKIIKADHLIFN